MQQFSPTDKQKFDKIFGNKSKATQIEKDYIKKAVKYIKYIRWIPGIKMVGIGNSIAMNSANINSDIDLLIVSDANRMWIVRIFCTLIFQILGVRKTPKKHAGRMCLSFFCTLKGMNFSDFCLGKDPYLYFWILYFKPLLSFDNTYDKFLEKNSHWADFSGFKNTLEKNKTGVKYLKQQLGVESPSTLKKILKKLLNTIDNLLKKLFLPKTLTHYTKIGKPFGVIINDDLLKFHNGDIRKEIAKKMG